MKARVSHRFNRLLPLLSAVFVTETIIALAGGVTFAALQSPQTKLTGSTIQSDTIRRSAGLAVFVYTPGTALVTAEIRRLAKRLVRPSYHLSGAQ